MYFSRLIFLQDKCHFIYYGLCSLSDQTLYNQSRHTSVPLSIQSPCLLRHLSDSTFGYARAGLNADSRQHVARSARTDCFEVPSRKGLLLWRSEQRKIGATCVWAVVWILENRGAQIFQKSQSYFKILGPGSVTHTIRRYCTKFIRPGDVIPVNYLHLCYQHLQTTAWQKTVSLYFLYRLDNLSQSCHYVYMLGLLKESINCWDNVCRW
jgi:hypothetical protein